MQGLPKSLEENAWTIESKGAILSMPSLKREPLQIAQPVHAPEKSSQPLLKRNRQEKTSVLGETGAVHKGKEVCSNERSAELAATGTFEEDEFFMSSSGTEGDGSKQHTNAASSPGLAGGLLYAPGQNIAEEQAKQAMSVLPHHKDSMQNVKPLGHMPSAGLATSQQPLGRLPAMGERKAVNHQGGNSKASNTRDARAFSTSRAAPAGKSSMNGGNPIKAVAKSKDAVARPVGQPLRTRAEGGRKRRKKS